MSQYSNLDWQYPGLSDVGAYQVSGVPFVSAALAVPGLGSAPLKISFPYVTKFITIQNTFNGLPRSLRIAFSSSCASSSFNLILTSFTKLFNEFFINNLS